MTTEHDRVMEALRRAMRAFMDSLAMSSPELGVMVPDLCAKGFVGTYAVYGPDGVGVEFALEMRFAEHTITRERTAELADHAQEVTCSGVAAVWCPIHGECTCSHVVNAHGDWYGRGRENPKCPLHGRDSTHGEHPRGLRG